MILYYITDLHFIYVLVTLLLKIYSTRYTRNLCSDDIEKVLTHSPRSVGEGLPGTVLSLNYVSCFFGTIAMLWKTTSFFWQTKFAWVLFIYLRIKQKRRKFSFCCSMEHWILWNGIAQNCIPKNAYGDWVTQLIYGVTKFVSFTLRNSTRW